MLTVGIRNLRNSLSRYLSLVKEGEKVMITDHNRVVAQLIPFDTESSDPLTEYTEDQIRSGGMLEARERFVPSPERKEPAADEDQLRAVYEECREERL